MRILIVDDKDDQRYLLETILKTGDHDVTAVSNGQVALDRLGAGKFDLIISDILMPQMDGFQFCRLVKSNAAFRHIPFIFYTATYTDRSDSELAMSLGAARFILKPEEPERLLSAVKVVMEEYEKNGGEGGPTIPPPTDEAYYKLYNSRLVVKLEKKCTDLEEFVRMLKNTLEELQHEMDERIRLEDELRRAQKMECIGRLAGGVAHDFNNLLSVISGEVSLMKNAVPENSPLHGNINAVLHQVERGADMTRQLHGIAYREKRSTAPLDLNDTLAKTTETFLRTHKNIIGKMRRAPGKLTVMADPVDIERVLMNLFLNAAQAMPDGGVLTLGTEKVALSAGEVLTQNKVPGNYAKMTVTDTGIGMDVQTVTKVFEPFFTTKEPGQGAGLGLASVFDVVKKNEGFLTVESKPAQGATFTVFLPLSA
jgi:signal transduction histidine kinase/CheY-like chemotaxis protein